MLGRAFGFDQEERPSLLDVDVPELGDAGIL
jgi:hypothetical protein